MKKWKQCLAALLVGVMTFAGGAATLTSGKTAEAAGETVYVNENTVWSYLDDNTKPADGWMSESFSTENWKTGTKSFGAKSGAIADLGGGCIPNVLLNQYINGTDGDDIPVFYFRTTFQGTAAAADQVLKGALKYDDAAVVYLNGTKIAGFDDGSFDANGYGGSNAGDPKTGEIQADAALVKNGSNVLCVEIHQGRPSSSDIFFEMSSLKLETKTPAETGGSENPGENGGSETKAAAQGSVSLTVGASGASRNLTWYSDSTDAASVQYAVASGNEFPADYTEVPAIMTAASNKSGYYSFRATLSGLQKETTYVYRLVNGTTVSAPYTFKTTGTGAFSFLLAGDPQIGASGNASNDTNGWGVTLKNAAAAFPNAAFLISAGDQVNTANNEAQYDGYLEHAELYNMTTATVVGNHDSSNAAYSEHFNNPNVSAYGKTNAGSDYWYVYNNVLFMNLNSNNLSTAEHRAFMKQAIDANPNVDWKVVVFHHSIYSVASHAYDKDILQRREALAPVFKELDIDVVLMGHDHVYTRSYMMDGLTPVVTEQVESSVTNPDGILYVTVNSASGSKFYRIKDSEFAYAAVKNQENIPNISNIEVTGTSFKITTYRSTDMSVVDSFEILRKKDEPSTEPTEPSAEPTEPSTEPTEPSSNPTESTAATDPSVKESTTAEPTKASQEPTKAGAAVSGKGNGTGNNGSGTAVGAGKGVATGDNTGLFLWISLLAAAGAAAAGVTVLMKKKEQ
ncbi:MULTISPECIES: metallophosphoesterase [unclassified Candidatus Paralachnospira]|uniref:metallophosphoesterase n=1 Tax=unclassified Candidatus Paralachnospira TaxID=3099471 RepID=UPI003F8E9915